MVSTTLWPAVHILGSQMYRAEQRVSLTITSLSLFHFLSLFKFFGPFFWALFWLFLTPLYAYKGAQSPHVVLPQQIYPS